MAKSHYESVCESLKFNDIWKFDCGVISWMKLRARSLQLLTAHPILLQTYCLSLGKPFKCHALVCHAALMGAINTMEPR